LPTRNTGQHVVSHRVYVMSNSSSDAVREPHEFPSTLWSLVRCAAGDAGPSGNQYGTSREALGVLLTRYLPALRAHLLRRGIHHDRTDDLLQSFVAERVLERDLLAAADAARGRFRAFLLTSLNNFAANQLRDEMAAKRAPISGKLLSLDAQASPEPAASHCATDLFDVAWARETLAEAVRRMRAQCQATGRMDLWEVLEVRELRPAVENVAPMPYSEIVERYGFTTPKQAQNALTTAKRCLGQALRSVLAEYIADEQKLEAELIYLAETLADAAHLHRNDEQRCAADWDLSGNEK
jgi:DNA-directed RNA polymerase specialized sigma24 family protein